MQEITTVKGPFTRIEYKDIDLGSITQLKDYLLSIGWQPTEYNRVKDPDGSWRVTSPKLTEDSFESLEGEIGQLIARRFIIAHRRRTILNYDDPENKGILSCIRGDGRVPAEGITCATPTGRTTHRNAVCNVPKAKAKIPYGIEMRSLFCVKPPYIMLGADLDQIEARITAHYATIFDGGAYWDLIESTGDIHCYSGDTEILTEDRGWVKFTDLSYSSKVAQYNINNGEVSFVKPLAYMKGKSEELNLHPYTRMFVTENHKQFLKGVGRKDKVLLDKDISYNNGSMRFITAGVKEYGHTVNETLLRAVVACQADGNMCSKSSFRFEFKKERKILRFRKLFNGDFTESKNEKKGSIRFTLRLPLEPLLTKEKEFSWELLKLNKSSIDILLDEVKHWDGTLRKDGTTILDTTSKQTADVIQALCSISGYRCRRGFYKKKTSWGVCEIHRVSFNKNRKPYASVLIDKPTKIYGDRDVYCITVPDGFLLTRREGFVVVSGNSYNATLIGSDRDTAKSFQYALFYGARAAKLSKIVGCTVHQADKHIAAFWDGNKGVKDLVDYLEKYYDEYGFIKGLDGRKIFIRAKYKLLNSLIQTGAGIVFKVWGNECDPELRSKQIDCQRIISYHDEYDYRCHPNCKEEAKEIIMSSANRVQSILELNVPITVAVKEGSSWAEVH